MGILIIVIISGILTIIAREKKIRVLLIVFKPMTICSILIFAFTQKPPEITAYFFWIFAGLVFGFLGDIFLMWPDRGFILGLISFLYGHLFFIAGFMLGRNFAVTWWILIPIIVYGGSVYAILHPDLKRMRGPVFAYVCVIMLMGWQACERWQALQHPLTLAAAIGALLFIISDSALAWNRFRRTFKGAHVLSLGTYYSAQVLIAYSISQMV